MTLTSGGLRRYVEQLSLALAREFPEDIYTLLSDQPFTLPAAAPPNLTALTRHDKRYWSWGIRRALRDLKSDVFHGTNFEVPYLGGTPSILTIHDLSPWKNPEWHGAAERVRQRTPWLIRLRRARLILTVSEAIAREIASHFGVPAENVRVVPLAPLPSPSSATTKSARPPYFLFVGTLEPRKNLPLLLEAWRSIRRDFPVDLILAGRTRADFVPFPQSEGLIMIGEVLDDDLPGLYSNALAFVYPSLYEGFGLPVLEAMQYGCPVIASRDPAVMEVAGGAAIHVGSAAALAEAMRAVISNGDLREKLSSNGHARARLFSWQRTARQTHEIYHELVRPIA